MSDPIDRLFEAIQQASGGDPQTSRTAKLFRDGVRKMAIKLGEEAIEAGIEAVQGRQQGLIEESADVVYQLCALWAACGITPDDVRRELDRRERLFGIAEKLPKTGTVGPVAA